MITQSGIFDSGLINGTFTVAVSDIVAAGSNGYEYADSINLG